MNFKRIIFLLALIGYSAATTLYAAEKYTLRQLGNSNPGVTVSYLFTEGVKYYLKGEAAEARKYLNEAVKINPDHAPSYYYLSCIASNELNSAGALEFISRAVDIDGSNFVYLEAKGKALLDMKDMEGAMKIYDALLAGDPGNSDHYLVAAAIANQTGKFEHAIEISDSFESRWGFDSRLVDIKRWALVQSHRYAQATDYLSRLTEESPDEPAYRIYLAELYAALHDDGAALENYHSAIAIDSSDMRGHMALAEYYRIKGDARSFLAASLPIYRSHDIAPSVKIEIANRIFFDRSLYPDYFREIDDLAFAMVLAHPEDSAVTELYARFLTFTGRYDQAITVYQNIIDRGDVTSDIYLKLIELEIFGTERSDSALVYIDRALEIYPRESQIYMRLSVVQQRAGQNKEAIASLETAFKYASGDDLRSSVRSMQGDLYYQMNNTKKAFTAYREALKYDPDQAGVLNNYAYYLSLLGIEMERALAMARRANELSASNATYLDTLAWVLHVMGRSEEAVPIMRQAMALDTSKSSEMLFHYGDILYAVGEDFVARAYWKRAAEAGYDQAEVDLRLALPKVEKPNK